MHGSKTPWLQLSMGPWPFQPGPWGLPAQEPCNPTCTGVQAGSLDWQDEVGVGRRAQAVAAALDDLERFPPPEALLQTQHYVSTIRRAPPPFSASCASAVPR